jgi:hypothetical protein
MTLPDYNFLPAPVWLITVLHVLTLGLHLIAMNFVLGGVILVLFARMSGKWESPTVRRFVRLFPSIMAAVVTLGVAPLLFVQLVYHRQFYAASITSGWWWLLIVAAVILAYYLFYAAASAKRPGAFLAVAVVALLYVSIVLSSVFSMTERPDLFRAIYAGNQSGWAVNGAIGLWWFRWLHMVAGAITVGGFMIGLVGRHEEPAYRLGRTAFLGGMVLTMLLGLAYIGTLGDHLLPYMRSPGIWLVLGAIVLSLGSAYYFFQRRWVLSGTMLAVSLFAMVLNRHVLRLVVLDGVFSPSSIPIKPQWSVFAIFGVCFVIALALVAWMLRAYVLSLRVSSK